MTRRSHPGAGPAQTPPSTRRSTGQPSCGESGRWWSTWFTTHCIEAGVLERQRIDAGLVQSDRASRGSIELGPVPLPSIDGFRSTASMAPTYRRRDGGVAARSASRVEQTQRAESASSGHETAQDDLDSRWGRGCGRSPRRPRCSSRTRSLRKDIRGVQPAIAGSCPPSGAGVYR